MNTEEIKKTVEYDSKTGKLKYKKNSKQAGTLNHNGYLVLTIQGKVYRNNRIAWLCFYGRLPINEIDHINGNKKDNRICNLRDVTHQENQRNRKINKNNTSGVVGVNFQKASGKWRVRIKVDKIDIGLGLFNDLESAILARKSAEVKHGFHENHGRK